MENWKLNRVDDIEHEPDASGVYVLINWDVQTDTVRLDFMSRKNEPIQSFAGSVENVRKAAMRYIYEISWPNSDYIISLEHAAYIGSELQLADVMRIDYVQDGGFYKNKNTQQKIADIEQRYNTALIRIETGLARQDTGDCCWYDGIGFDGLQELQDEIRALQELNPLCIEQEKSDAALLNQYANKNKTKADDIVEKYNRQMLAEKQFDFIVVLDATRFVTFERYTVSSIDFMCSSRYYLHKCPDTDRVFLCEAGLDNNIAEIIDIEAFQNWLDSDDR